jgi:hypothetical protein
MELLHGLSEIKALCFDLAKKLGKFDYFVLDGHRVFNDVVDPAVNVAVFRRLTADVELVDGP